MRATEYLFSVANGIQEKELYSHIDITDPVVRKTIAEDRRIVKKAHKQQPIGLKE